MSDGRVMVPRLTSGSWKRWVTATLAATLGMAVYFGVTRPADRWAAVTFGTVFAVGTLWALSRRTWVEVATGTVVRETLWCLRRRVPLRRAKVELVNNQHGALHLSVRDRRRIYLPVLLDTVYVQRVQSPEILRVLVEQLIRHAPHARAVVVELRRLDVTRAQLGTLGR